MDDNSPSCPFCPFTDTDATFVAEHIDFCHPEGGAAPDLSDPIPSSRPFDKDGTTEYMDCPYECGETITAAELSMHLDLHAAEGIALDEDGPAPVDADMHTGEHNLPSDDDDLVDVPGSRKSGKHGATRDFAHTKANKSRRARSPPGMVGPDGAKRLGVYIWNLDIRLENIC